MAIEIEDFKDTNVNYGKIQKEFAIIQKKYKAAWGQFIKDSYTCPRHIKLQDRGCGAYQDIETCKKCWEKTLKAVSKQC